MAVPVAASMRAGDDSKFDRLLRDTTANEPSTPAATAKPRDEEARIENELGNDNDVPVVRERSEREDVESPVDSQHSNDEQSSLDVDAQADVTESIQRGEPEQQAKPTGKGTDSPRTSQMSSEPLIAASLHAQPIGQQQVATNLQGQNPTGATARAIEPAMTGTASTNYATSSSTKIANVQGAYSAKSAAQAQMLEQARDSVFKQILMKLNSEGGEVRMRLEPPDLGQLDLRMTVEGGNKLSLTISADRQDINQLLHRHLDELKQSLQASGLEITGAEVQTRSEFEHQQAQRDASNGEVANQEHTDTSASIAKPRGYITADGLDFWA
jgi:flagellar hook-length control protein FliK